MFSDSLWLEGKVVFIGVVMFSLLFDFLSCNFVASGCVCFNYVDARISKIAIKKAKKLSRTEDVKSIAGKGIRDALTRARGGPLQIPRWPAAAKAAITSD